MRIRKIVETFVLGFSWTCFWTLVIAALFYPPVQYKAALLTSAGAAALTGTLTWLVLTNQ